MEFHQLVGLIFSYLAKVILDLGGIGMFILCAMWFIAGAVLVFVAENINKTFVVIVLAFIVPLLMTTVSFISIINQVIERSI